MKNSLEWEYQADYSEKKMFVYSLFISALENTVSVSIPFEHTLYIAID